MGGQGQGGMGGQGGLGGFGGNGQGQGFNGGFQGGFTGNNNPSPYIVGNPGSNIFVNDEPPKNINIGPNFNMVGTVKTQPQNKPK